MARLSRAMRDVFAKQAKDCRLAADRLHRNTVPILVSCGRADEAAEVEKLVEVLRTTTSRVAEILSAEVQTAKKQQG